MERRIKRLTVSLEYLQSVFKNGHEPGGDFLGSCGVKHRGLPDDATFIAFEVGTGSRSDCVDILVYSASFPVAGPWYPDHISLEAELVNG